MGKQRSLRSKAVNLVSDLTTVLLNPISDKPSKNPTFPSGNEEEESERNPDELIPEEGSSIGGPDTSSFTAFLYSLLKDDYFSADRDNGQQNNTAVASPSESELESEHETGLNPKTDAQPSAESENGNVVIEVGGRKGLLSRGKQTVSKAMSYAARLAWYRNNASQKKPNSETESESEGDDDKGGELESLENKEDPVSSAEFPGLSEPSMLLSVETRTKVYASLPCLVKGKKWVLLYSTWRHGISLSTLYRKSNLCPGPSLLVVGDGEGAVFGGLVEAPLKPNIKKRYQGSVSSFLFTDAPGQPFIYLPTGSNRYFTLCSPDFLALGGGCHFALYLDSELAIGSSAASETYGNPCLSLSEDFKVKHVELWGFAYASRYKEVLAASQNEPPGICRW